MSKHSNKGHEPDHNHVHHAHLPYWRRAHHDWRAWIVVLLMFAAIVIYVMSQDLSMRPGLQPQQPMPADVAQ